jgi:hypothetical protein
VKSLVALAKHYEHMDRNHARALEFTLEALRHQGSGATGQGSGIRDQGLGINEELMRRKARLEKRVVAAGRDRSTGVGRQQRLKPQTSAKADAAD